MCTVVDGAPDWATLADLYHRLARVERHAPGSTDARDLEAAIDLLLEGRLAGTPSTYRRHDAVRRARFLRRQADVKRAAAAARQRRPDVVITTRPTTGDTETVTEPVDRTDPADVVCARETVRLLATRAHASTSTPHQPQVLAGLLADQPNRQIAIGLGVSRSTVDRAIAAVRQEARRLVAEAAAA
jgi:DNA-directed RNA polymerase specialized sigma24 family protein